MANRDKRAAEWAEAKEKCRLNVETLKMAQEMGLNPRSLIKTFLPYYGADGRNKYAAINDKAIARGCNAL